MQKSDVTIYFTTDYGKFQFFKENRDVKENRNLLDVIKNNNKLKYNPIIVDTEMRVLDGQHRLSIAKELEVPIYYVIDKDCVVEDIQALNMSTKNWTMKDHLDFHAKTGNSDYIIIKYFTENYQITIPVFCSSFCVLHDTNSIKKGKSKLKYKKDVIEKVLRQMQDIYEKHKSLFEKYFSSRFQQVIIKLLLHEKYCHKRFLDAIDRYPDDFIKASRFHDLSFITNALMDGVYNKRYKENNRIKI